MTRSALVPGRPRLRATPTGSIRLIGQEFREDYVRELALWISERVHVVEPFEIPTSWERFEPMDHGQNNPTCWLLWAVDYHSLTPRL